MSMEHQAQMSQSLILHIRSESSPDGGRLSLRSHDSSRVDSAGKTQQKTRLLASSLTEYNADALHPDLSISTLPQINNNVKYVDLTGIEPANPGFSGPGVHQYQAHMNSVYQKLNRITKHLGWWPNGLLRGGIIAMFFFLLFPKPALATNTGIFTAQVWVKPTTSIASQALLGKAEEMRIFTDSSGYVGCQIKATTWQTAVTSSTAITLNKWSHVSCTYDKINLKIYVNGVQTGSQALTTLPDDTANVFKIGQDDSASTPYSNLTGVVDGFEFYNYALTSKQVTSDMGGSSPSTGSGRSEGPIGYWKFDEGYGQTTNNSGSSGSSLNGFLGATTASGEATDPSWSNLGKFGKALSFDGGDYASIPNTTTLAPGSGDWSFSAWVKSTASTGTNQYIYWDSIDNAGNNPSIQLALLSSNNTLYGLIRDASSNQVTVSGAGPAIYNQSIWHYVTMVLSNKTLTLYVDGINVGSNTNASLGSIDTGSALTNYIGAGKSAAGAIASFFNGFIDEPKIYNYVLTADEVKTEYNRGQSIQMGAAGTNSTYQPQAANQEYCVPGDTTSCAAPIGRWDFEEGTGSTANDTSGNGRTLTWVGTGTKHWISGKFGKAGNSNGSDDNVPSASINDDYTGTGNFTAEAWFKANVTNAGQMAMDINGTVGSRTWYLGLESDNTIGAWLAINGTWGNGVTKSTTTVTANKWYFVAATYSGTTWSIYVNGKQENSGSKTVSNWGDPRQFAIGAVPNIGRSPINGAIDNVRLFNYARSAAQVAWDYNRGKPVGWWKMDECQGTTINDSSGNSNTGTLTIGTGGTQTTTIGYGTCTASASTPWYNGRTGKRNASLNFDGTDDYVNVGSNSITGTNPYTLSAWVKGNSMSGYGGALGIGNGATNQLAYIGWVTTVQVGTANSWGGGGYGKNYGSGVTDITNWHHITLTSSGGSTQTLNLYIDGILRQTNTETFSLANTSTKIGVLDDNGTKNYWFNGQIDDVRIFNYALTATQVKDVYNGGAVNFAPLTGSP
ncbi:MAG: LamG domain-containing protein [bacterium]|nr:LamG domain-containing protein [bacterium]